MLLSISEFSEMCQLPTQTLRFYHSEGLLVPADVNACTGYRSYTFDQVERAMLIATLRRAGLSVRLVRQALDDVDATPALLTNHREELRRQRKKEDEALDEAQAFTTDWPQVRGYHTPDTTVLSTIVPGGFADDAATSRVLAAAHELTRTAESCGATVTGVPWKAYALDTTEQKKKSMTREGPDWSVTVPVSGGDLVAAALPATITLATFHARDEVSIVVPGRESLAKYATALQRLASHAVEQGQALDLGQPRHLLHHDSTEIAMTVWEPDDDPAPP
jgi:DNA-binding transcriptional MerR regulator